MLLVALMVAAAAGLIITPWSALPLGAALLLFLLSAAPFLGKAWAKDRAVALASPFLLLVRAGALGFGYGWGLVKPAVIGDEETGQAGNA